ncbi:MAG: hypothetical protein AAF928_06480 [Myxococcota bacterium]
MRVFTNKYARAPIFAGVVALSATAGCAAEDDTGQSELDATELAPPAPGSLDGLDAYPMLGIKVSATATALIAQYEFGYSWLFCEQNGCWRFERGDFVHALDWQLQYAAQIKATLKGAYGAYGLTDGLRPLTPEGGLCRYSLKAKLGGNNVRVGQILQWMRTLQNTAVLAPKPVYEVGGFFDERYDDASAYLCGVYGEFGVAAGVNLNPLFSENDAAVQRLGEAVFSNSVNNFLDNLTNVLKANRNHPDERPSATPPVVGGAPPALPPVAPPLPATDFGALRNCICTNPKFPERGGCRIWLQGCVDESSCSMIVRSGTSQGILLEETTADAPFDPEVAADPTAYFGGRSFLEDYTADRALEPFRYDAELSAEDETYGNAWYTAKYARDGKSLPIGGYPAKAYATTTMMLAGYEWQCF